MAENLERNAMLKGLGWGVAGGMVAMWAVGFMAFGWVTGGTAEDNARNAARIAATEALVPVCVANANADPGFSEKMAGIREARTYQRDDNVMDAGWATFPGSDEPNRAVADACAKALVEAAA